MPKGVCRDLNSQLSTKMKRVNNSKLAIAFVIDEIEYGFGGTETQLVRLLDNINKDEFRPILCCLRDSQWVQDNREKYEIYVISFYSYFSAVSYKNILKFSNFLKTNNIPCLQTYFRDGNIVGTISAKLSGIKTLISSRRNMGYWYTWKELLLLKLFRSFTTLYLCNSNAIREVVIAKEKVSANKVKVIPNSIDFSNFSYSHDEEKEKLCNQLDIKGTTTIITIVANLRPIKDIGTLIRSIRSVIEGYPETLFLVVGSGSELKNLSKLCESEKVSKYVQFLGSREDVPQLLCASDIGVLTSKSEGLSNSLIEYSASRLPVIYSDILANREASCENCGIAYSVGDHEKLTAALKRLISNPALRKEMGESGYRHARERYDLVKTTRETEELYSSLAH